MEVHTSNLSKEPDNHFDWADVVEESIETSKNYPAPELRSVSPCDMEPGIHCSSDFIENPRKLAMEEERACLEYDIHHEFNFRNYCITAAINTGDHIHHFNWMGSPVSGPSFTPPAISLMFMRADPKTPQYGDLRIECVLVQAIKYVDPLIIYSDNEDLPQGAHDLIRWSTGRVFKFYTPHGSWAHDTHCVQTVTDFGEVDLYRNKQIKTGTGFLQSHGIRGRQKWQQDRDQLFETRCTFTKPRFNSQCKEHKAFIPSPLRQVMTLRHSGLTSDIQTSSVSPNVEISTHVEVAEEMETLDIGSLPDQNPNICDSTLNVEKVSSHNVQRFIAQEGKAPVSNVKLEDFKPNLDNINEQAEDSIIEQVNTLDFPYPSTESLSCLSGFGSEAENTSTQLTVNHLKSSTSPSLSTQSSACLSDVDSVAESMSTLPTDHDFELFAALSSRTANTIPEDIRSVLSQPVDLPEVGRPPNDMAKQKTRWKKLKDVLHDDSAVLRHATTTHVETTMALGHEPLLHFQQKSQGLKSPIPRFLVVVTLDDLRISTLADALPRAAGASHVDLWLRNIRGSRHTISLHVAPFLIVIDYCIIHSFATHITMDEDLSHILLARSGNEGAARGQQALVVTAVLTALSIVVVGMRIFARAGLMKFMGREDWTIIGSLVLAIVYFALVCAETHFGLGRHKTDLTEYQFQQQLKRLWVAIPFYNASLGCTKFSILFQYLRIFPDRQFRLACYIVMAIVATYTTWAVVSGFVNCVPVAKFWDQAMDGSCLSFEAVWFFNASMNIVTDLALLILPMPLLSHLQLPRMQKFALMGVFAMGILVVITSILRLSSLKQVARSPDTSWSNVGAAYWTAAECNVAIICACLPFLRPLVSCLFPKFLSTQSQSYKRYTRNPTTTAMSRSRQHQMELYSQDREYGMYSINVKSGNESPTPLGGIEVTTEMIQETEKQGGGEATSQRRLVVGDEG
ncbi:hypothetical protein FE257_006567 [Aspergillus nanangensis]|uniref:Rhodopsin domain-containing protein n=1 Tax=Aspergillus nanangensis TaxID=2582783 RepID=A0AAD4CZN3_ASPNN|nr:hypothetical protein FE257_006567 [Aspergillus nanangensis]